MSLSSVVKSLRAVRGGVVASFFALAAGMCLAAEPYDRLVEGLYIPKTAWFDTGYVTKGAPRVTTRVLFPDSTTSDVDVFGTKDRADGCFILNADNGRFYLRYGKGSSTGGGSFAADQVYDIVCDSTLTANSKVQVTATAGSMAGNTLNLCFPGKGSHNRAIVMGAFKLEEDGQVVRDMVPCEKDGAFGYYDKIGKTFYAMQGTGELQERSLPEPVYPRTCTWTGAAGDGKFGTAGNWDKPPRAGVQDTIVIDIGATALTLENDIEGLTLNKLVLLGDRTVPLTLNGRSLSVTGSDTGAASTSESATLVTNACSLVMNAPLTLAGKGRCYFWGRDVTFNGQVSLADGAFVRLWGCEEAKCTARAFNAPVYGPKASLLASMGQNGSSAKTDFNDKVTLQRLYQGTDTRPCSVTLAASGNEISNVYFTANALKFTANDALTTNTIIGTSAYTYLWDSGSVNFEAGTHQVANRLDGADCTKSYPKSQMLGCITDGGAVDLLLKGTADATCYRLVKDAVSITWAPDEAFTQTFAKRINTTTGTLTVSNGTVRLASGSVWSNLTQIVVWPTGRLVVDAENGVAEPFPVLQRLYVAEGALVTLPADVLLTAAVNYKGSWQAAGSCVGSAWLQGEGTVTARAYVSSDVTWNKADGGDWNAPANWTPTAIPDAAHPAVVNNSADGVMTVTVESDAVPATNLTVSASTPFPLGGKVAFDVTALWPFKRGWLMFDKGTDVTIGNGGKFVYDGAKATGDKAADERVVVKGGSSITVKDGGFMQVTNLLGQVALDGGMLTVEEGGRLDLVQTASSDRMLNLKAGSKLDVKGRVVVAQYSSGTWALQQTGGDISLSGNGCIETPRNKIGSATNENGGVVLFGTGKTTLTDEARIFMSRSHSSLNLQICPSANGETAEMTLSGHSAVTNTSTGSAYALYVGNNKSGTCTGSANLTLTDSATFGFNGKNVNGLYSCNVGARCGKAEMTLSSGRMRIGCYNFSVGWAEVENKDANVTGKFVLKDGAYAYADSYAAISRGSANSRYVPLGGMYGLRIGYWQNAAKVAGRPVKGVFEMSGADTELTVGAGCAVIGVGKAEGTFTMTDGDVRICESDTVKYNYNNDRDIGGKDETYYVYSTNANVVAVGMLGGKGALDISGGRFYSNIRTFVGGCKTNEWFDGAYNSYGTKKFVADLHDAEGLLKISGGSYVCTKPVVVGSDGTGTVEIGPAGTFSAPTLVLSNQTASVLSFKANADGFTGCVNVTNLVLATGATMNVDLGGYEGKSLNLIRAASVEGDFAAINVTGKSGVDAVVRKTPTGYRLCMQRGSMIIIR